MMITNQLSNSQNHIAQPRFIDRIKTSINRIHDYVKNLFAMIAIKILNAVGNPFLHEIKILSNALEELKEEYKKVDDTLRRMTPYALPEPIIKYETPQHVLDENAQMAKTIAQNAEEIKKIQAEIKEKDEIIEDMRPSQEELLHARLELNQIHIELRLHQTLSDKLKKQNRLLTEKLKIAEDISRAGNPLEGSLI